MKTQTKVHHTPTPWHVFNQESCSILVDKKNNCIATQLNESNAAFIVRAVNCHEELLSIARQVAGPGRHIDSPKCFHCKAAQAIAKATRHAEVKP